MSLRHINIDKKIFNPLFFKIWKDITFTKKEIEEKNYSRHKRFIVSLGSAGSGKSYVQTQIEILKCLQKKEKLLVIRKVGATLNDSVISLFIDTLDLWEIEYTFNKVDRRIGFPNGSVILFKGLDNPEKIKSIAGITRIWVEECTELTVEDFDQLNARLRGKQARYGQITLTFNPISELHWLKKRFFDEDRDDCYKYHTTFNDNRFIDEEYKIQMNSYKHFDMNFFRVYCLGEFGIVQTGAEMYRLDHEKNSLLAKKYSYDPNETLYLSADENVHPLCAIIAFQLKPDGTLYICDEFAEKGKNIMETCKVVEQRYLDHKAGVIITGDATSRKQDAKQEKGVNFFSIMESNLSMLYPKVMVPLSNENVYLRSLFINKLLWEEKVVINPDKCKETINDMLVTKFDHTGAGKDKSYVTKTGLDGSKIRYQEHGHFSDVVDYACCTFFKRELGLFKRASKPATMVNKLMQNNSGAY